MALTGRGGATRRPIIPRQGAPGGVVEAMPSLAAHTARAIRDSARGSRGCGDGRQQTSHGFTPVCGSDRAPGGGRACVWDAGSGRALACFMPAAAWGGGLCVCPPASRMPHTKARPPADCTRTKCPRRNGRTRWTGTMPPALQQWQRHYPATKKHTRLATTRATPIQLSSPTHIR